MRFRRRVKLALVALGIQLTLPFSPRPTIWLMSRVLLLDGAGPSPDLERHAPAGMSVLRDEAYGDGPRERFDLHRPADADGPLPVIVWLHGGGWVGGSKVQSWPYFQVLAAEGYAVVAAEYALAPGNRYPTPARQIMRLLAHLQAEPGRLGVDPQRIVLAGDSAGAHIAAQVAALVTTPGYAELVGVEPTVAPEQLRGVILACGPYDLHGIPRSHRHGWTHALFWAYSGTRRYATDPHFATWSVAEYLSPRFPPTLLTVGDTDPLYRHTVLLADRLRGVDVDVETVLPAPGTGAGHEYQFELDTPDAQEFLRRAIAFLASVAQRTPA